MPSSGVQTCALRSEEHTSELQSHDNIVCRLLLEKKNKAPATPAPRPTTGLDVAAGPAAGRGVVRRPGWGGGGRWWASRIALFFCGFFFFNDPATTEIYTLPLPDALPISARHGEPRRRNVHVHDPDALPLQIVRIRSEEHTSELQSHDNLVCRLLLEK